MSLLDDFVESDDISFQQILNNMLDGTKNLDLKSHIYKPKELASLMTLSKYLKTLGYKKSHRLIKDFIGYFLRYMVSYKRESRKEIIKAIAPNIINPQKENSGLPTSIE